MFFCSACAELNKWPESLGKSYGPCEVCGLNDRCSSVPSSALPIPPRREDHDDR